MECEEDDKTIPERDLYLFSVLPEITYNATEGGLSIVSPHLTFESVKWMIMALLLQLTYSFCQRM